MQYQQQVHVNLGIICTVINQLFHFFAMSIPCSLGNSTAARNTRLLHTVTALLR